MKILLVNRLESCFFAFKKSIDRFISFYEMFIKELKNGHVYISKDYANKIFFVTTEEMTEPLKKRGLESAAQMLKILKARVKNTRQFTDEQEHYLKQVIVQLEERGIPKQTAKETFKILNALK